MKRFSYFEGNFYSYNFYTKQIHKHNKDFEIIDSLGVNGPGPHENLMVLNYEVLDENRVAIFDAQKKIFKIQTWEDSVLLYFDVDRNFDKGLVVDDSSIFVTYSVGPMQNLGASFVNVYTNKYREFEFQNSIFDNETSSWTFEGKLTKSQRYFYSFSYFYSDFFRIDRSSLRLSVERYGYDTEIKKPTVISFEGGFAAGDNPVYVGDGMSVEDKVYILSYFGDSRHRGQAILDVYQEDNFSYLISYALPNFEETPPNDMFSDGKYIYLRYESYLLKASLPEV